MEFSLSKLDHERFGWTTAKAKLDAGDGIEALLAAAREARVRFLIVRLPVSELQLAQELERVGGILTDTLVYYHKQKIERYQQSLRKGYTWRTVEPHDEAAIGAIAAEAFKGYFGHYHADPHLDRGACDAVYSSWAQNSCKKGDLADDIILIEFGKEIAAFATLKKVDALTYEGVLFGVAPGHQGKGLHLQLMQLSQNWGLARCFRRLITSTQITNLIAQKNWCRVGMEPFAAFYTFHIWMNDDSV